MLFLCRIKERDLERSTCFLLYYFRNERHGRQDGDVDQDEGEFVEKEHPKSGKNVAKEGKKFAQKSQTSFVDCLSL